MVKKIINRLFGKDVPQVQPAQPSPSVPDELPPLAEDLIRDLKAPPIAPADQQPQQGQQSQSMQQPMQPSAQMQQSLQQIPPNQQPTAPASLPHVTISTEMLGPHPSLIHEEPKEEGFFGNVLKVVQKQGMIKDKFFEKDLFDRMQHYWDNQSKASETLVPSQRKIEYDVINKLSELKDLENKWRIQREVLEHDKKYLKDREGEIKKLIEELMVSFKHIRLYQDVAPDKYFYFKNGMVAKNLHELVELISIIDDATLQFHVNAHKNDVVVWVDNIVKDHEMADRLKGKFTRDELMREFLASMVAQMETEEQREIPIIKRIRHELSQTVVDPEHYFWLKNGFVMKSVKDLLENLKSMDDGLFRFHVGHHKNDFANWVAHVFKQDALATMMKKTRSREELVELLQVYV